MSYALCDRIFHRKEHIPLPVCPSMKTKKPPRRGKMKIKDRDKLAPEANEKKDSTAITEPEKKRNSWPKVTS